jgi:hypothetical protein
MPADRRVAEELVVNAREGKGADTAGMDFGPALIAEMRDTLWRALHKIEHCLNQLSDADMSFRPRPEMNSIAIVINHLCGNLKQWIISGLSGAPDDRNRPREFVDPGPVTVAQVRDKLKQRLAEVDRVLAGLDPGDLLRLRRVQGFEVTGIHALVDTVSHFVGHTHQIVQWTRLIRGEKYQFDFVPKGKEQGGAPS